MIILCVSILLVSYLEQYRRNHDEHATTEPHLDIHYINLFAHDLTPDYSNFHKNTGSRWPCNEQLSSIFVRY
ncbi:hypothetical protein BDC45DRAFT_495431 [Circinella umbellata]|nr:hypothetical protein BDC45DRAFT_495431 [Circinella umbellata]